MWSNLGVRLKGWRTLIAAGLAAMLGLADVFGAIDLRPLVRVFVHGDEAAVGAVMTALALGFALLRLITTGPVGDKEAR
jgi:chromate transport protein ChrA